MTIRRRKIFMRRGNLKVAEKKTDQYHHPVPVREVIAMKVDQAQVIIFKL
jgi:hypothetical protein